MIAPVEANTAPPALAAALPVTLAVELPAERCAPGFRKKAPPLWVNG